MDTDTFIQPGDPWRPESAARYNQVNEVLNSFSQIGPASDLSGLHRSQNCILCRNAGNDMIPAFSYVTIDAPGSGNSPDFNKMTRGISPPCGVVLSDCSPGECASVQICGITPAEKSQNPPDAMVIPGFPDLPEEQNLVNLTGSGTYRNYFKVEAEKFSENGKLSQVKIIDGGHPEDNFSGYTDAGCIEKGILDVSGDGFVILLLSKGENRKWKQEFRIINHFEFNEHDDSAPYFVLAEIYNNRIIQRWTGGMIYWRTRFIIPQNADYDLEVQN